MILKKNDYTFVLKQLVLFESWVVNCFIEFRRYLWFFYNFIKKYRL